MSANNYLLISKKKFTVKHLDADSDKGSLVGKGKNLEEAIQIAENFEEELNSEGLYIEYGIRFTD